MADMGRRPPVALEARPAELRQGDVIVLAGSGLPDAVLSIEVDGEPVRPARIIRGFPVGRGLRPDGSGDILVHLSSRALGPGEHRISARGEEEGAPWASVVVHERPRRRPDGRVFEPPYWRALDFFQRRFGHLGFIPPGVRLAQIEGIRALRRERDRHAPEGPPSGGGGQGSGLPGLPEPTPLSATGCNWNPVGPGPVPHGQTEGDPTQAVAGRTPAIAIDPTAPGTVLIGTAGGGIWKTTDGGETWAPKTDHKISLAVDTIAFDPTHHLRVLAGTGEFHHTGAGGLTYYGNGVLRSQDAGETWSEHATDLFQHHEISKIVFDPTDTTGQTVYLAASNGVFVSGDNGQTWASVLAESVSDLVAVPLPGSGAALLPGAPGDLRLLAGVYGLGVWQRTRTLGLWGAWTPVVSPAFPTALTFGRIALGQCAGTTQAVYALFGLVGLESLCKSPDGGDTWAPVTIKLNRDVWGQVQDGPGQIHAVVVPAGDLTAAPAPHTYTMTAGGSSTHAHTVGYTAAQIEDLSSGKPVTESTPADGTGHQHLITLRPTRQAWYNLHCTVHPTDPNTVFLGEVRLWRSTTGGGVFEDLTDGQPAGAPPPGVPIGIHGDQHALVFDPANAARLWAGNDGGVYRSDDGGNTWVHRNRGLQTLQYVALSLHPTWEAVMLGGTQDNGTHRYLGHPAWAFSDYGDGGFNAIDPSTPTRMYHGYVGNDFYRSDAAGTKGTWVHKTGDITGPVEFYPPFALDPSDPKACYFGNEKLWRSPDSADTWKAITPAFNGQATAIAVHPTNPAVAYVGTSEGRVYHVEQTGGTWDLADVATTNITTAALPAGLYISDLAVDTAGNVWVTYASVVLTEAPGEFTNDHVFRLDAATGVWEKRVSGLVQANPVNTIVIDPADESRLFVGADVGVFRTEDAGDTWTLWDEGLPNVPVFHLAIGPQRLIRAGTHGRGVWERPIDALACPLVDLYVRDNVLDTGRVVPSPDHVPHPFDPAVSVHHWQSPDIKVDAPDTTFQTADPVDDFVRFEGDLVHETARRKVSNRFYAQVHNRGAGTAHNVKVRAFFAAASPGLPPLPADFWTGGGPFAGTPSGPDWTPIGATRTIAVLAPAEPGVVEWDWTIPMSAPKHSCLLVVTTCTEDPIDGGGILDPDALVLQQKHVALKNLQVENAVPGSPLPPAEPIMMELFDSAPQSRFVDLVFEWGTLPRGSKVFVALEELPGGQPACQASAHDLQAEGAEVAAAGDLFPKSYKVACRPERRLALDRVFVLSPAGKPRAALRRVRLPRRGPLLAGVNVILVEGAEGDAQFDVMVRKGRRLVGGCTYVLRPARREDDGELR